MMQEPLILAVETSSRMGSVALAFGGKLVSETRFSSPLKHSVEIFPAVRGLLDHAGRTPDQIEQVYISHGPGSFTGLRIAATLAKTMHLANAAKIITVDTLDIIAANVVRLIPDSRTASVGATPCGCPGTRIAVVLDAKRGQFFIAVYQLAPQGCSSRGAENSLWKKVVPDSLMTISEFLDRFACPEDPIGLLGDGLVYYRDRFKADGVFFLDEQYWSPQANKVHLLGRQMALNGQFADPLTLTPNYLRKPNVTLKSR
jgi:tRNA threonylcarbamoyladenosine biosynthesis protein TsaB